uniref:Uncharacterized protein n=1 Tax=Oncorhynchus mykiss TaxID=8022 RepID=A0A8C7PRB8_ONCMY
STDSKKHLKKDVQGPCSSMYSADCVDLMDRTGELVNLSDKEESMEQASSLMKKRHSYVLIRDGTEGQKYVPLLNDLDKITVHVHRPCLEQTHIKSDLRL